MPVSQTYVVTEIDENGISRKIDLTSDRLYEYDEAIDLTGNGFYNVMLLITLSMATLAMGVDIFGFSVVVDGATCDFNLTLKQTGILLAVTFVGPIVMAYPWGYISDTQGRKKSLMISLWASFIISTLNAFSPNWTTMAVLKLLSTSFSSCAQSATYTLLGECCPHRVRDAYMLIMTSILDFSLAVYVGLAHVVLQLDFALDVGFTTFTPWRLLAIVLSLPLGIAALGILFFHESPNFMLNEGRNEEALAALADIWKKNGNREEFPVKQVMLKENGNKPQVYRNMWLSLWEHLVPLFKPPFLWRSLQLYFLTAVVYGTNNSYYIWFPYLAKKFIEGIDSTSTMESGLCTAIVRSYQNSTITELQCISKTDINMFWASVVQGFIFVLMLISIARVAHRKRLLIIIILGVSSIAALGAVLIREKFTSFMMFFGMLLNELIIGMIYSYFVELYPTSFRGTAACIGTMVARGSALGGVNLLGDFIMTHCAHTFYVCSALTMGGVLVALLLPSDKQKKSA